MKRIAAVLVSCAAVLAVPASSQAIVNGTIDGGAHPSVGALTVPTPNGQVLACTGTLVSPTVLVTAGHCTGQLQELGYTQAQVSFDPNIGTGATVSCGLTDCYVAPSKNSLHTGTMYTNPSFSLTNGASYSSSVDSHDVAVVVFDKPVKGIAPASLPTAGLLDAMSSAGTLGSATFTNVGYGWFALNGNGAAGFTGLLDGQRRYATGGSQSLTTSDLKVTENPSLGYGGACSHDSGGPVLDPSGSSVVAEISALQSNGCSGTYDGYRLDTPSARSFLSNFVAVP